MEIHFSIKKKNYVANLSKPLDISIPVFFGGKQPNAFNATKAVYTPYLTHEFIGDVRRGGAVNCDKITMIPHCNGTHTECVGHISRERISLNQKLGSYFMPAVLISVKPEKGLDFSETYIPDLSSEDSIITSKLLENAIQKVTGGKFYEALVIRTLPNGNFKKEVNYMERPAPFFSIEAMQYLVSQKVRHLLVDIPSVDRAFDEGKLTAHHIWWGVEAESHEISPEDCSDKTITEMIYVDDKIKDGIYLLNLAVPAFELDGVPSRPVLYRVS